MKRTFTLIAALVAVSCSGSEGDSPAGSEGGACLTGGACNAELVCASNICVRPPDDNNGATNNGATNNGATNNGATNNGATNNGATNNGVGEPPVCAVQSPTAGDARPYFETWDLSATGNDAEDGTLASDQIRWESDVSGPLGEGAALAGVTLEPGVHTLRCIATDSDGNEGSGGVEVTVLSPVARINHPGGEDRGANEAMGGIPFAGEASDLEDGQLGGMSLQWSSDIDGAFGEGTDFRYQLSAGQHTVTLTATDSDGNVGSDTLTFNVVP